jgi:hypothetical protein
MVPRRTADFMPASYLHKRIEEQAALPHNPLEHDPEKWEPVFG